jgi:cytochrome c-type biogenesis protein CcmF
MASFGRACLALGLTLAAFGALASVYGARRGRSDWIAAGRRSVYALAMVLTAAFAVLEAAFIRTDLSYKVVAGHSSTTTPLFYRMAAPWSSQEGSLLLWVWLLSIWSSLALLGTRRRLAAVAPYATAVLLGFAAFFAALDLFLANPFAIQSPAPAEGAGLEPLLQHASMMIHPPMLYSGYTLFTIPFAFAIGALITGRLDAEWIRSIRRFALLAWLCLGVGILLGARWSWTELGWGGYWAWDPVENAALMPWLTGTAFIHSVMIQEKRGMLRVWNVSLILGTGILAILGTFLVRSGILQSIHAFGGSTLGKPFLVFIGLLLVASVALVSARLPELRSRARLESLVSRESVFLLNNFALLALCFVIFWGTFFPLISEAATGSKSSVGPPWFDRYTVPLAIVLVLLSGLGPLMTWRRASLANARRNVLWPLAAAAFGVLVIELLSAAGQKPLALALFGAAVFVAAAVVQEFARGASARRTAAGVSWPVALIGLVRRNRRRYGGYLVHLGVAVMLVGVAASSTFQHIRDVRLTPGQTAQIGGYDIRYLRPSSSVEPGKVSIGAVVDIAKAGRHVVTLRPTRSYYPTLDPTLGAVSRYFNGNAETQVGLRAGVTRDIWGAISPDLQPLQPMISQADRDFGNASPRLLGLLVSAIAARYQAAPPAALFRVIVSPLVEWIWIGGTIGALGALIAMWPARALALVRIRRSVALRSPRPVPQA